MQVFSFEKEMGNEPDNIDQIKKYDADIGNAEIEKGEGAIMLTNQKRISWG
ncbi:hypothetical protein [Echinicola marina]|uniref:hypothetical protein n=1 Tax=Echinicola marina TaxID=2859768 RepID=UPI001CF66B14|nr:hypothetical protein [Echinicola marina]